MWILVSVVGALSLEAGFGSRLMEEHAFCLFQAREHLPAQLSGCCLLQLLADFEPPLRDDSPIPTQVRVRTRSPQRAIPVGKAGRGRIYTHT
jgi:hypothetical protein